MTKPRMALVSLVAVCVFMLIAVSACGGGGSSDGSSASATHASFRSAVLAAYEPVKGLALHPDSYLTFAGEVGAIACPPDESSLKSELITAATGAADAARKYYSSVNPFSRQPQAPDVSLLGPVEDLSGLVSSLPRD